MNSVFKYPGAKWSLADWIIEHFPPHHSYLEPFLGSGAVLFSKSRSAIETANDLDGDVINLFTWIRNDPDRLANASCDGTWLLSKDCLETRGWHSSNTNDYKNSTIHSYLNNTWLNKLDANIRAQVKQAKLPYVNGTANSAVASGANGLACKIFLLSGYEVGFTQSDNSYFPVDGAKLA